MADKDDKNGTMDVKAYSKDAKDPAFQIIVTKKDGEVKVENEEIETKVKGIIVSHKIQDLDPSLPMNKFVLKSGDKFEAYSMNKKYIDNLTKDNERNKKRGLLPT
jgi:hypothetical protein